MSISVILLIIGIVLFAAAVWLGEHRGQLTPAGLAFFAASFLPIS